MNSIDSTLVEFNKIIENNREKIQAIYGFVKLFDPTRITSDTLEEKTKEITAHCRKSTESRCLHGRSLGADQTNLSARILAGFDINLYDCEFVDIATGNCIKDFDSNIIETKDNNYFNMIINWYKMKVGGLSYDDILENIEQIYSICAKNESNSQSKCTISG